MSLMLNFQKQRRASAPDATVDSAGVARIGAVSAGKIGAQQLRALLDGALAEDLKSISAIKSMERRIDVKRDQLIPKYWPYVNRLRADGKNHDILGYFLVWLFDTGDIESGLDLGDYMAGIAAGLPERFNRDLPTFMADGVLAWAEAEYDADRSPEPYFSKIFDHVDAMDWDLPDALRAKYYRLRGLLDERLGNVDDAVANLERAMALGAKVKTKLNELAKQQTKTE